MAFRDKCFSELRETGDLSVAHSLRRGRAFRILSSSLDAATYAVEVYNRPRATFRTQNFVMLMIVAWTRLFHAHFCSTIGDRFYYKERNGRYRRIDGERKAWDLSTCINRYGKLSLAVHANLDFAIRLRNKVEHRYVEDDNLDSMVFGECQALLYNFEALLTSLFGQRHALNAQLMFSLQFSNYRPPSQRQSIRAAATRDLGAILDFVTAYRNGLEDDIFVAQEYSVKLFQAPKVAATNRADMAVEFIRKEDLSDAQFEQLRKAQVLIREKQVFTEARNVGRLRPSEVCSIVNSRTSLKLGTGDHAAFYAVFGVRKSNREISAGALPTATDTRFCIYDDPHNDFVYTEQWADFLIHVLATGVMTIDQVRRLHKAGKVLAIDEYLPRSL